METSTTRTYSDELQLQGTAFDERLEYLVGVFYLDSKETYFSPLWTGAANASGGVQRDHGQRDLRGLRAGHVQADRSVELDAGWPLHVGEDHDASGSTLGVRCGQSAGGDAGRSELDRARSTIASIRMCMVYATTRGSWRRGGFNPFNPPTATPLTAANDPGGNYFLSRKSA